MFDVDNPPLEELGLDEESALSFRDEIVSLIVETTYCSETTALELLEAIGDRFKALLSKRRVN